MEAVVRGKSFPVPLPLPFPPFFFFAITLLLYCNSAACYNGGYDAAFRERIDRVRSGRNAHAEQIVCDREMVALFLKLLAKKKVAVIGGGKYAQFQKQFLGRFPRRDPRFNNLFLFPTTSNAFYRYHNGWKNVYTLNLSRPEKKGSEKYLRRCSGKFITSIPKKFTALYWKTGGRK